MARYREDCDVILKDARCALDNGVSRFQIFEALWAHGNEYNSAHTAYLGMHTLHAEYALCHLVGDTILVPALGDEDFQTSVCQYIADFSNFHLAIITKPTGPANGSVGFQFQRRNQDNALRLMSMMQSNLADLVYCAYSVLVERGSENLRHLRLLEWFMQEPGLVPSWSARPPLPAAPRPPASWYVRAIRRFDFRHQLDGDFLEPIIHYIAAVEMQAHPPSAHNFSAAAPRTRSPAAATATRF